MTDQEYHHDHRVRALIELENGGAVNEVFTEWDSRRDFALETAEALRDHGFKVQIDSRPVTETVELEAVPE